MIAVADYRISYYRISTSGVSRFHICHILFGMPSIAIAVPPPSIRRSLAIENRLNTLCNVHMCVKGTGPPDFHLCFWLLHAFWCIIKNLLILTFSVNWWTKYACFKLLFLICYRSLEQITSTTWTHLTRCGLWGVSRPTSARWRTLSMRASQQQATASRQCWKNLLKIPKSYETALHNASGAYFSTYMKFPQVRL